MSSLLSVRGLSAAYGDLQALWDVSLEVEQGEIVALLGANGAGKSTLLTTVAGLHPPAGGAVLWEGQPVTGLPAYSLAGRGLILVPEGRRLFDSMSVAENLELGAYSRRARERRAQNRALVFELFPLLGERQKARAETLSGGQQQMLAIGRALMGEPRLLMLDEPSLGLAPLLVAQLFETLRSLKGRGISVLLVEQNARQALELCERAYILEHGVIAARGSGRELAQKDEVRRAYLGLAPAGEKLV